MTTHFIAHMEGEGLGENGGCVEDGNCSLLGNLWSTDTILGSAREFLHIVPQ
jgi:hypothetical protein